VPKLAHLVRTDVDLDENAWMNPSRTRSSSATVATPIASTSASQSSVRLGRPPRSVSECRYSAGHQTPRMQQPRSSAQRPTRRGSLRTAATGRDRLLRPQTPLRQDRSSENLVRSVPRDALSVCRLQPRSGAKRWKCDAVWRLNRALYHIPRPHPHLSPPQPTPVLARLRLAPLLVPRAGPLQPLRRPVAQRPSQRAPQPSDQ
jgi:hypothetical protein